MAPHLEDGHHLSQALCLVAHGRGCGTRLLDQGSVLLRHLVELAHGLVHLGNAIALLLCGGRNLAHQIGHAAHAGHNLSHVAPGLGHLVAARLHTAHAGMDQGFDLFGRLGAALGQLAHLPRHHGKATPLLARARGLDGSIERQNVGLEGNAINHANDVANLAAGSTDGLHAAHGLLHHGTTALGHLHSMACQLVGLARRFCRLPHRVGQLVDAGRRLLQLRCRLLSAP